MRDQGTPAEIAGALGRIQPYAPASLPFRFGPRVRTALGIPRRQLLRHLTAVHLLGQLILVRGPAGSGKTTLLAQWVETGQKTGRPVAWLTLDAADENCETFIAGLADALQHAGYKGTADGFRSLIPQSAGTPIALTARRLASASNSSREQPTIILDQFERVCESSIGQLISALLQQATSLTLIIASRIRPSMPLAALRARHQLVEIGPSDLHLTLSETQCAFSADVPDLYARRLHLETSGEAVAVGFARRELEDAPADRIDAGSWQEQLGEYYREEVLHSLLSEWHSTMGRLVIVERFDASLAQALAGREALELIQRLHEVHGLLLRHRGTDEFYFPEMLRRFLESRLAWLDQPARIELHRCAVQWFLDRGRLHEALRHAVKGEARDLASNLLEQVGYCNVVSRWGVPAARHLLNAVAADQEALSPDALLSLSLVYAHEGNVKAAVANLAEAKRRLAADAGASASCVQAQLLLAEGFVAGFSDETARFGGNESTLERYLESTPPSEHQSRAQALILLSWNHFCRGDLMAAERLTDEAASEYAETEAVYGSIFMHVHRALAQFWRNELDAALVQSDLADKMTRIFFAEDQRLRAMTGVLRANVLFELGRASPHTDPTDLVGTVGALESWLEMQLWAHRYGARAAVAAGRPEEARAILSYGVEVAERLDMPRLAWNMHLLGVDLSTHAGDLDRAWHDARRLRLTESRFLADAATRLTWQERIAGLLTLVRLLDERAEFAEARRMIDMAETETAATSATRFAVAVQLARARLEHRQGRPEQARVRCNAARALVNGALPVRLFLDGGECLQPYLFELGSKTVVGTPSEASVDAPDPLTARERQILMFLRDGHPNKVAAHRLGLSEATVKFHLRNIYRKLNAQNRIQALAHYRNYSSEH